MESVTIADINKILKDAPENLLIRVLGYIEGILEDKNNNFKLSTEQMDSIREIKARPYSEHTDIEVFLNEMNEKYGN